MMLSAAEHSSVRLLANERRTIPDTNSLQSNQSTSESVNTISASSNIAKAVPQQPIKKNISRPSKIKKVKRINKKVIKMIAKGHHDLGFLEKIEFHKLINLVSQSQDYYELPFQKILSNEIVSSFYNEIKDEMKIKIQAASALSLSIDGWTSKNNESYITIVAHFVDNTDIKLQSALLVCFNYNYNEEHTSQNLCDFMKNVMAAWNISHKIQAIVSNNDAKILAAIKLGGWQSISCFAHSLNFVVVEATKKISDVFAKVNFTVQFFNHNELAKMILIDTQREMKLPRLKLKQNVQTLWKSNFEMLLDIIQIKDAVIATVALFPAQLTLNEEDWAIIEAALTLLCPFYEIIVEIIAEKTLTLSKVMMYCNLLNSFLNKHVSTNEKIFGIQSVLKKGMENRFKEVETVPLYAICQFLDPRFKTISSNKRAIENVKQSFYSGLETEQLPKKKEPATSSDSSAVGFSRNNQNEKASIWDEYEQEIQNITKPGNDLACLNRELFKYGRDDYLDRKEDPLQWWHERRQFYPKLYQQILKKFSIVATSVPCERVFSENGQILNECRTMLSTKNISELVCLHSNL